MPRELNGFKQEVLYQLSHGKSKAVTGKLLAKRLGQKDDRTIRLAIRELIHDGVAVASSVGGPPGFYLIESREEAEEYMAALKSRLVEDALRRSDFKRASRHIRVPQQLSFRLEVHT